MFESLYEELGLEKRNFQLDILNKLVSNILKDQKMQVVMIPNAAGKTTMIMVLSLYLKRNGFHPLIVTGDEVYWLFDRYPEEIRNELYEIEVLNEHENVDVNTKVDVVLTDSIRAGSIGLEIQNGNDNINMLKQQDESPISRRCNGLINIIKEMYEKNKSLSVISFEVGESALKTGYIPIIATSLVTCLDLGEFDAETIVSCVNEYLLIYENLINKKIQNHVALTESKINKQLAKQTDLLLTKDIKLLSDKIEALQCQVNHMQYIMNEVVTDVKSIKDVIGKMNKMVLDNKSIIEAHFSSQDVSEDYEDRMISKLVTKLANEMLNKSVELQNHNMYKKLEKILILKLLEENWTKMDQDSQKFLVTSKYTLVNQIDMLDELDYSGVCVLASKAFELELAKRFIKEYKEYVVNNLKLGNDYGKWPGALLKKSYNRIVPKEINDFSLGDCKGLMGLREEREVYRKNHNELFIRFCKDKLLKIHNETEINIRLKKYDSIIQRVKDDFRNPSSHKAPISVTMASDCVNYIAEVERVLGVMLSDFCC